MECTQDRREEVRERLIEVITIVRRSLNRDQVLLSRSLNERFKHKKTANLPTMTRKGYSSDNYHVEEDWPHIVGVQFSRK